MEKSVFEELFIMEKMDYGETEKIWDVRAQEFNINQKNDKTRFPDKVTALLNEKNILSGADVLDVGGGSGRYAIPFASYAHSVTLTDLSYNMLQNAEANAKEAGFNNLNFVKMEWTNAEIKALEWEKKFDLVFASMCPAVRSLRGLENMSLASKGYCLINQFVYDNDSVCEYLDSELKIKKGISPHNDRKAVQGFFNVLWMDGYEPEIGYLKFNEETEIDINEAISNYSIKYDQILKEKNKDIAELLSKLVKDGKIKVVTKKIVATILWHV